MSDHDIRENAKRAAAEAVAAHLELSDRLRIKTSLRNAGLVVMAIISSTVSVCAYLNHISNSQDRIEAILNHKVSETQFRGWATALDKANRTNIPGGLNVPDPGQYTEPNPQ